MKKIITGRINEEEGVVLGEYLAKELKLTRHQIAQAKFREDGIRVNGIRQRITHMLKKGDVVSVLLEEKIQGSSHLIPVEGRLQILYEDEDLLAVDKPAGLVTHPSPGHYTDSLANYLAYYFKAGGQAVTVRAIGRLDRETSGIVVFAKNQVSGARLSHEKKVNTFKKTYVALVKGTLPDREGRIQAPIGKVPGHLMKMCVSSSGKEAVTDYQVLAKYGGFSAVSLSPLTGRTHQLRVHMAFSGNPLLGDALYGGPIDAIGRTALHACSVQFLQPFTGEEIRLKARLPADMKTLLSMS